MKQYYSIKKRIVGSLWGWLFISPMVIGIIVFTLYPVIESILYSFHDYDMISKYRYVKFGNYIRIFKDVAVLKAFKNTFIFGICNIPLMIITTYVLALLLNTRIPAIKAFRIIYYLPCVVPSAAAAIVWSNILKYGTESPGIFNTLRLSMGWSMSMYFNASNLEAIRSILLMNLWGVGGGTVVWLAAFNNIPEQLYEAAEMDGAGKLTKILHITIPLSGPLFLYNMITLTIATVQFNGTIAFAPNAGAGNNDATLMLGVKVYIEAFRRTNIGYAAALSWILMIITAIISVVMFKVDKWMNNENY